MLKQIRQTLTHSLWHKYRATSPYIQQIETYLHTTNPPLDHFAVIDLPGPQTGIHQLKAILTEVGYRERGTGYLTDKQNDFLWLAEEDSENTEAHSVLPQIVVADFRLMEMPNQVRNIIEKYAQFANPSPLSTVQQLVQKIAQGDVTASTQLNSILLSYFVGREWPLPTIAEYQTVKAFNELLAWVLIYGRRPNHFTLSVHLLSQFNDLTSFLACIENDLHLPLNREGGLIKGNQTAGIAQASTVGMTKSVQLADGQIELATDFIEFVWRYPINAKKPILWSDFFTGFVPQHADYVVESLYINET